MKARKVKNLDPEGPLAENAARIVRVRTDELRSFAPKALDPENSADQHDMRIAAKRLRYVLEATELCFGKPAATARRSARDLQSLLGELHDCDVMLPRVERHLAELREQDGEQDGGLETLIVSLEARRRLLFEGFTELWAEQERAGTWDTLDRAAAKAA